MLAVAYTGYRVEASLFMPPQICVEVSIALFLPFKAKLN
jgi:hypothetical protein